jgi:TRAP-type transport system small permease protein
MRTISEYTLKIMIALFLLLITSLVIAQVLFRFVLSNALPWPEELGRLLFSYLVFIGGGLASLHEEHISVELLDLKLPDTAASVLAVIREVLVVLVMVIVIRGGLAIMPRAHRIALSATGLPKSLMTLAVILGAVCMGLDSIKRVFTGLRRLASGSRNTDT